MIWTKEPIKMQNFRLSTAQVKCHQNCTLIGSFCWKHIKYQLKMCRGIMSHDTEEWCEIWTKTDVLFPNQQELREFWPYHLKVKQICTLIGAFCAKYIKFDLKKYRGIVFHDTEEWYKVWRKTDLWFGKWHEEFRTFSPERSKVSKLGLWWDTFIQSRKCMSLKFTGELTIKNDAKFEEELACYFKIGMRNLRNFDTGTWKSQKLAF